MIPALVLLALFLLPGCERDGSYRSGGGKDLMTLHEMEQANAPVDEILLFLAETRGNTEASFTTGGRDPFFHGDAPAGAASRAPVRAAPVRTVPKAEAPSPRRLQGILAGKGGATALIDGAAVHSGGRIGDLRVIAIGKTRVWFENGEGKILEIQVGDRLPGPEESGTHS